MERWEHLTDADHWWERVPLAAMVAAILIVGIFPSVLTDMIEPSARARTTSSRSRNAPSISR